MNRTIKFNGINRNNSITNNADGNCEEILNLRPKAGRWEAVARKAVTIDNGNAVAPYGCIYELENHPRIVKYHQHKVGNDINEIVMVLQDAQNTDRYIAAYWLKKDGPVTTPVELWKFYQSSSEKFTQTPQNSIDIESIGNFLTFNLPEVTTYLFQDGEYKTTKQDYTEPPTIDFGYDTQFSDESEELSFRSSITLGDYSAANSHLPSRTNPSLYAVIGARFLDTNMFVHEDIGLVQACDEYGNHLPIDYANNSFPIELNNEIIEAVGGAYLKMQNSRKEYREGFVFIRSAYELFDGSYTNFSTPVMVHLGSLGLELDNEGEFVKDIDKIDTIFNPDKFQITRYCIDNKKGGETSPNKKYDLILKGKVRRQRMQSLIIKRPTDLPNNLGDEFSKIVYFVSKPISMYDFNTIQAKYLHFNMRSWVSKDKLDYSKRLDTGWCYSYCSPAYYEYWNLARKFFRTSLGNPMNIEGSGKYAYATTPNDDSFREAIYMHTPTQEELENMSFFKAVEFDIKDTNDVGYIQDNGVTGKVVDFSILAESEIAVAELDSTVTYEAAGLETYNKRLHLYGVTQRFKSKLINSYVNPQDVVLNPIYRKDNEYHETSDNTNLYRDTQKIQTSFQYKLVDHAVFTIKKDNKEYKYVDNFASYGEHKQPIISFPDNDVKKVDLYFRNVHAYYKFSIGVTRSKIYNLSFVNFFVDSKNLNSKYSSIEVVEVSKEEYDGYNQQYEEWVLGDKQYNPKMLKVSEQMNPLIYPVENTYQFDDTIVALGTNHKEVSLAQEGQYPMYVFTKKGIWAMGVGSAAFYATQIPVNPDVAVCRHTLGIGNGVLYIASDGIKVINGRECVSISEPINGFCNDDMLTIKSIKSALGGTDINETCLLNCIYNNAYSNTNVAYTGLTAPDNIVEYLCMDNSHGMTHIGYDRVNNELLFSKSGSVTSSRTFVFSLNEKVWTSRDELFYSFYRDYGCRMNYSEYLTLRGDGAKVMHTIPGGVVELTRETDGGIPEYQSRPTNISPNVLIITRPLSLGTLGFKQINHIALRGDMMINSNPYHFGFYVLASNDGREWKMVGGKVWVQQVTQVVLERIKQSYRYIAFMIAGVASQTFFNVTHIDIDGIEKYNTRQR